MHPTSQILCNFQTPFWHKIDTSRVAGGGRINSQSFVFLRAGGGGSSLSSCWNCFWLAWCASFSLYSIPPLFPSTPTPTKGKPQTRRRLTKSATRQTRIQGLETQNGVVTYKQNRAFLNLGFGEPIAPWILVVFVISVLSADPAINPLACGCLSCLRHFRHFRDSHRFREKHRSAKHRFGKT